MTGAGFNSTSGVTWIAAGSGFYGVQNIGTTVNAVNVPSNTSATLYRVTLKTANGAVARPPVAASISAEVQRGVIDNPP